MRWCEAATPVLLLHTCTYVHLTLLYQWIPASHTVVLTDTHFSSETSDGHFGFHKKNQNGCVQNSLKLNQNIIYLDISLSNKNLHPKKLVLSPSTT